VATALLAETQGLVVAGDPDPVSCDVVFTHSTVLPEIVGLAFTVTVKFTEQPTLLVYVITVVPAATPVTNPLEETVAMEVFEETQGVVVAAVAEPVNCVVAPTQTTFVPVIVGMALIVTVAVIEQLATLVYVIVVVPVAIAVTIPVLDIVATEVFEETQGFVVAAVPDPVN
jgi:hypothetical protein